MLKPFITRRSLALQGHKALEGEVERAKECEEVKERNNSPGPIRP